MPLLPGGTYVSASSPNCEKYDCRSRREMSCVTFVRKRRDPLVTDAVTVAGGGARGAATSTPMASPRISCGMCEIARCRELGSAKDMKQMPLCALPPGGMGKYTSVSCPNCEKCVRRSSLLMDDGTLDTKSLSCRSDGAPGGIGCMLAICITAADCPCSSAIASLDACSRLAFASISAGAAVGCPTAVEVPCWSAPTTALTPCACCSDGGPAAGAVAACCCTAAVAGSPPAGAALCIAAAVAAAAAPLMPWNW
mmetsp:Transcript_44672/g.138277  ORF Transcript_44672/g.138277 Transcript_44672/m.138277 type:complete len:253 (-) Transcript_44672:249-1007(-)